MLVRRRGGGEMGKGGFVEGGEGVRGEGSGVVDMYLASSVFF